MVLVLMLNSNQELAQRDFREASHIISSIGSGGAAAQRANKLFGGATFAGVLPSMGHAVSI